MATSSFFSPLICISHKPFHSPLFISPSPFPTNLRKPNLIVAKSNGSDSVDASDRFISALCYFYPFFDGIQYGKYVITQFYPLQAVIQPLVPAIRVFKSFPFNGFLVFFTLYFVVVRNPNFTRLPIVADAADRQRDIRISVQEVKYATEVYKARTKRAANDPSNECFTGLEK
ncbi:hypothetical protein Lal_00013529 [Lupinus albus]|nr:hypothetical protein Lal_00013529 [Lupinus albus]